MIKIYEPFISKETLKYAHEALDSTWISSQGKYVELASGLLAEKLDVKHVLLTNNGTAATHLTALSLKFQNPNIKQLIVPNNVFVAAWNSMLCEYTKSMLYAVDCSLETWNTAYDESHVDPLDKNTAFLVVHNVGNVVNVPKLQARFKNALFIEDNCEGLFGRYENQYTGTASLASSISFFSNKTITSGEGGAYITNDSTLFEHIKKIHSQGQGSTRYLHDVMGYNYRMTNIQAAILYGQLQELHLIQERKSEIFAYLEAKLNDICTFPKREANTVPAKWMVAAKIDHTAHTFVKFQKHMTSSNIEVRPMFYPISAHAHLYDINVASTTNAISLNEKGFMLPSHPNLTNENLDDIIRAIREYVSNL
jgi:perosamine synthetase